MRTKKTPAHWTLRMNDQLTSAKTLFLFAQIDTFGFITLLQFLSGFWFVMALLAMHSGILMFIFARKRFEKLGIDSNKHFLVTYIVLSLYLPILIYKLLSRIIGFLENEALVFAYVVSLTAIAIIIGVFNTASLFKRKAG